MTTVSLRRAVYVYGLVRDDGTPLPDVAGVGGSRLRSVEAGGTGIAAVVSDARALGERVGKGDLMAHSEVLQALIQDRDVLPVRFGSVYPSDEEMCGELLATHAGRIRRLLKSVEGRVEMQVKAAYAEEAVTAEIVGSDRRVRKARDRARSAPGDRGAQVELGRRFAAALDARKAADAGDITRRLDRLAEATRVQPGRGDFAVAKVACLVRRAGIDRLVEQTARIGDRQRGRIELRTMGPLPPYSFVSGSLPEVG